MNKGCVAIIPARGSSKRIPRKNLKPFFGVPIIQYSIKAALVSECFDEVMVSTEDAEIATVSQSLGATVPFLRSAKNADDMAMFADVIEEVLLEYKKRGIEFTYFCCILATVPFISSQRLKEGFEKITQTDADSVFTVSRLSYPIQQALKIDGEKVSMMWPENYNVRSQDFVPAYQDSGQFYWMRVDSFFEQKRLFAKNSVPLEIPETEVQDIDTEADWQMAEVKYKILNNL